LMIGFGGAVVMALPALGGSSSAFGVTLIVAALIYWALTTVFQYFQTRLEKRLSKGYVRGAQTPAAKPKLLPQSGGGLGGGAGTIEIPEPYEGGGVGPPAEGGAEGSAP